MAISQRDALPFELSSLEIKNEAHPKASYSQVIDHLAKFVVSYLVDDFGVHYNFSRHDEIRNVLTHCHSFVQHIEPRLLLTGDVAMPQLNEERVFVRLFKQAVSQCVEDFYCRTDYGLGKVRTPQSVSIRVHPWLYFIHF